MIIHAIQLYLSPILEVIQNNLNTTKKTLTLLYADSNENLDEIQNKLHEHAIVLSHLKNMWETLIETIKVKYKVIFDRF